MAGAGRWCLRMPPSLRAAVSRGSAFRCAAVVSVPPSHSVPNDRDPLRPCRIAPELAVTIRLGRKAVRADRVGAHARSQSPSRTRTVTETPSRTRSATNSGLSRLLEAQAGQRLSLDRSHSPRRRLGVTAVAKSLRVHPTAVFIPNLRPFSALHGGGWSSCPLFAACRPDICVTREV